MRMANFRKYNFNRPRDQAGMFPERYTGQWRKAGEREQTLIEMHEGKLFLSKEGGERRKKKGQALNRPSW